MRIRTNISNYGVSLSDAKNYCRIEVTDDDALVSSLISASYEQVCAECNRDFTPADYTLTVFSSSGDLFITTQNAYNINTGSVRYIDGSWYSNFSDTYTGNINYSVASGSVVPNNVKTAQLMLVSQWYDYRQSQVDSSANNLDFTVNALLNPYKFIRPQ